jgi:hypothetical protein
VVCVCVCVCVCVSPPSIFTLPHSLTRSLATLVRSFVRSLIRCFAGQVLRWGWPGSGFVGWNTPTGLSNEVPPLGGGTPL